MSSEWLVNWSMVFLRASGLLLLFPILSSTGVTVRMRVALSALMAFLICPGLPDPGLGGIGLIGLVTKMAFEIAVGLVFGFMCRLIFYAVEMAGAIISSEIGLNLPPSFNPMTSGTTPLLGTMLTYLTTVLWVSLDLHHWVLLGFRRSFEFLPIGAGRMNEAILDNVVSWTGGIFVVALQMVAPVMAVTFVLSLVFAVLGRAVSQMNVFTESFAVRLLAGLTAFGVVCQLMAQHIVNYLNRLPEDILRVAALLRAGN